MVSKNLKYILMLAGMLAVAPVAADSGRKLGGLQAGMVRSLGIQPDQASFGLFIANFLVQMLAGVATTKSRVNLNPLPKAYAYIVLKYVARLINVQDGIVGHLVNGTKDVLLTGSVEDVLQHVMGNPHTELKDIDFRLPVDRELSAPLKAVSAAITLARAYYMYDKAQSVLTRVEEECKVLGVETGITTGLVPEHDAYLVIENPLKTLALGAKQASGALKAWQEPLYNQLFCPAAKVAAINAAVATYHAKTMAAGTSPFEINQELKKMVNTMLGNDEIVAANTARANKIYSNVDMALLVPVAFTHFRGRSFVPYDTFKLLTPGLQEDLLALVAFNTVRLHGLWASL